MRMMLDHSVGVPVLRGELAPGELYDWDRMVARLEAEEPFWEPGTRHGYHMINFGWTVGELVRRASGRSLGTFFREAIAEPLGIDFWIGLPEEHEAPRRPGDRRTAAQKGDPLSAFELAVVSDRSSVSSLAIANVAGMNPNSREAHAAEIGGGGGITNGRGLAGMYTPLALGGGGARRPRRRRPHAAGVERGQPRRHAVHRDPLRDGLHGQHGQPRPARHRLGRSSASTPSATSAPAAASASPTRRAGWRSATR